MRQPKAEHLCPKCNGVLKKTIGAASRQKFWECVGCGWRRLVSEHKA